MVTMLNTAGQPLHPGDLVEWAFYTEKGTHAGKRARSGPRRFGITIASVSSPKIIGRCLSFAKAGESVDILLKCVQPLNFLPIHPTRTTYSHALTVVFCTHTGSRHCAARLRINASHKHGNDNRLYSSRRGMGTGWVRRRAVLGQERIRYRMFCHYVV